MINLIAFPQDTNFLFPLSCVGLGVLLHEVLTYPIDRIISRTISNQQNGQLKQESFKGLFKGFRTSLDRNLTKHVSSYFVFQALYNKYGMTYYSEGKAPTTEQPMLRYCDGLKFYEIALFSTISSTLLSQPSNTVKLKIQCEPLGVGINKGSLEHVDEILQYHSKSMGILFAPGLKSRLLLNYLQFIMEVGIIQQALFNDGYAFINKNSGEQLNVRHFLMVMLGSAATSTVLHPLYYLHKRYMMRKMQNLTTLSIHSMLFKDGEGIQAISRGCGLNILRCCSRNGIMFGLLWSAAK